MELTSPAFENNGSIPARFTCEGENVSPELKIAGVPEGCRSLVLIMYDPDIPEVFKKEKGILGWDHWTVWNIPASTAIIREGIAPGVEGKQTGGAIGYTGPCPPKEYLPTKHRYYFWLFALNTELDLPEGSTKAEVESALDGFILAKAELMGTYEKAG